MIAKPVLLSVSVAAAGVSVLGAAYAAGRSSIRPALVEALRLARTDALTGITNRAGLDIDLARRAGGRDPWVFVLVDLDGFKQVNDSFGYAAGDAVLVEVARRLGTIVEPGRDLVARLGGDEFVIAASGFRCHAIAKNVALVLRRPIRVAGRQVAVTASIGWVTALPGDDPRSVKHSANIALYGAKTAGKNLVVEFDPAAELAEVEVERPAERLRDLTTAGRDLAGVRR